jgi:hypothetical protein
MAKKPKTKVILYNGDKSYEWLTSDVPLYHGRLAPFIEFTNYHTNLRVRVGGTVVIEEFYKDSFYK